MPILETITAIANGISDVSKAVTKGLPSTEEQLAEFKERSPLIYQRIHNQLINRDYRRLRRPRNKKVPVTSYVQWEHSDLPKSEQDKMIEILQFQLGRL